MATAPMRPAPPVHSLVCVALACLALSCASPAPSASEPRAEHGRGREKQRAVLAKTTPAAVARSTEEAAAGIPAPASPDTARPGRLLIYSAITGHIPLDGRNPDDPSARYRTPAEREAARTAKIEAEIDAELALENGGLGLQQEVAPPPSVDPASQDPSANPLAAPPAPTLRELPDSLFESREVSIPPGQWQNRRELQLLRQTLDVDDDGAPEEVRYLDIASGKIVRAELDRDFDGALDAWITFDDGEPVVRVLDTNGNSRSDTWERYSMGRLEAKTLDRDHDGVKDTFYRYRSGELSALLRDANNDGTVDRVEAYAGRHRTRTEEDRTLNGYMDTWTRYEVVDEREVVARIEHDTHDQGKPNVFETYETLGDRTLLSRKEEDLDGDGSVDVVSTYENGRLVQRAISDEALSPL